MNVYFIIVCFLGLVLCILAFYTNHTLRSHLFRKKILKKRVPFFDHYEFDNIYETVINQLNMKEIEKEHKNNCTIIFKCILCVFILSSSLLLIPSINSLYSWFGVLCLFLFCYPIFISEKISHKKYKEEFIPNLIPAINQKIKYMITKDNEKNELYSQSRFEKNKLHQQYIFELPHVDIHTKITDYMEYHLDSNTNIELVDILLEESGDDSSFYIFEGILAKIPKKNFLNNHILIKRNKRLFKRNDKNKNFKKYFFLYNENMENIDDIITNNIKETLVQLYEEYGIPFEISIINNSLYIRFFTGPLFESSWKPSFSSNKKKLYGDYVIFKTVLELIEKINNLFWFLTQKATTSNKKVVAFYILFFKQKL